MSSDRPDGAASDSTAPPLRSDVQSIFHLVTIASQRAKQLSAGARPRVDPGRHRPARIALLEVTAGLVSWTLTDAPIVVPIETAPLPPARPRR